MEAPGRRGKIGHSADRFGHFPLLRDMSGHVLVLGMGAEPGADPGRADRPELPAHVATIDAAARPVRPLAEPGALPRCQL